MSLRELVEPDCGGANPLMRLGSHVMRDAAYKDEGLSQMAGPSSFINRSQQFQSDQLIQDFQRQIAMPPQTFRMDSILQEMREMDAKHFASQLKRAPAVIEEVNAGLEWTKDFLAENNQQQLQPSVAPAPSLTTEMIGSSSWVNEFSGSDLKVNVLHEVIQIFPNMLN